MYKKEKASSVNDKRLELLAQGRKPSYSCLRAFNNYLRNLQTFYLFSNSYLYLESRE